MKLTFLRRVVNALPPSWSRLPLAVVYYATNGKNITEQRVRVKRYAASLQNRGELDRGMKAFLKTLSGYCLYMNRAGADKYLESYLEHADFACVRRRIPEQTDARDVILICCVKNDLTRVKAVYRHHRQIGVQHMVFVDNMSDDGTLEWLLEQDVDVYRTAEKYHAGAKSAWVRKVQEVYGFDRWYLLVDSDELFSYVGMEQHPIRELIAAAEERGLCRVRGFLLDMYTKGALFQTDKNPERFTEEYRYFDADSYYSENDCRGLMLRGGPRKRIFEAESDYAQPLTKYPLLRVGAEDVWADHTPMPFEKNFKSACFCVLRHYKFLPEDKRKFYKIAQDGNYAKGSYEYKNYIAKTEQDAGITFFYEGSQEYLDSDSLKAIPFVESVFLGAATPHLPGTSLSGNRTGEECEMRKLAAVVVTYNRLEELKKNLDALEAQTVSIDRIYVVDNHSNDGTFAYLKERENDRIRCLRLDSNIGGAGGFSKGVQAAYEEGYDYIILMDDDGRPWTFDSFEKLVAAAASQDNELLMINPLVSCDGDKLSFQLSDYFYTKDIIARAKGNLFIGFINPFNGTLISRQLVKQIGYPNASFFIKGDEADYTNRARRAGALVATVTNSMYYHPSLERKKEKVLGLFPISNNLEAPWKEYYRIRNYTYMQGNAALVLFSKRLIKSLLIHDELCWARIKMICHGLKDGKNKNMGITVEPGTLVYPNGHGISRR